MEATFGVATALLGEPRPGPPGSRRLTFPEQALGCAPRRPADFYFATEFGLNGNAFLLTFIILSNES